MNSVVLDTLGMVIPDATFIGPSIDDIALAESLPNEIFAVIRDVNGFIAFGGALHFRGVCSEPVWHSLAAAWTGENALYRLYKSIDAADVPFAQDALGNQFISRDDTVFHLEGETGELTSMNIDVPDLLALLGSEPETVLPLRVVALHRENGGELRPGQLLNVYPPFCTEESSRGVSVRAVSMHEQIAFLADFASQISKLPDGSRVRVSVKRTNSE